LLRGERRNGLRGLVPVTVREIDVEVSRWRLELGVAIGF
jgi:hypothetical protein